MGQIDVFGGAGHLHRAEHGHPRLEPLGIERSRWKRANLRTSSKKPLHLLDSSSNIIACAAEAW